MIGPEFQSIWDQQSIKQKVKMLIELQDRFDVFEFERNLMVHNAMGGNFVILTELLYELDIVFINLVIQG